MHQGGTWWQMLVFTRLPSTCHHFSQSLSIWVPPHHRNKVYSILSYRTLNLWYLFHTIEQWIRISTAGPQEQVEYCRNQSSRNQAPHPESWRTQVYYTSGSRGVNSPSSEPWTKGLQSLYTRTAMIKRVCEFAGAGRLQRAGQGWVR